MKIMMNDISGVLNIAGTLDIDAAEKLREALLDLLLHRPEVALNLSAVDASDTAALQVLLAGRQNAASLGKAFRVVAVSPFVTETAAALGFSCELAADTEREFVPVAI